MKAAQSVIEGDPIIQATLFSAKQLEYIRLLKPFGGCYHKIELMTKID